MRRWTVVPGRDRFLVLATDGVWDVLSNGDVAAIVLAFAAGAAGGGAAQGDGSRGGNSRAAQAAANALVRYSLQRGSADNVTALVVDLATKAVASSATLPPKAAQGVSSVRSMPPAAARAPLPVQPLLQPPAKGGGLPAAPAPAATKAAAVMPSAEPVCAPPAVPAQAPPTPQAAEDAPRRVAEGESTPVATADDLVEAAVTEAALRAVVALDTDLGDAPPSSDAATVAGSFSPHLRRLEGPQQQQGDVVESEDAAITVRRTDAAEVAASAALRDGFDDVPAADGSDAASDCGAHPVPSAAVAGSGSATSLRRRPAPGTGVSAPGSPATLVAVDADDAD